MAKGDNQDGSQCFGGGFITSQKDAHRCIVFDTLKTRISFEHLPIAVQNWGFHRIQDIPLNDLDEEVRIGPIPVDLQLVCFIYVRRVNLDHFEINDFLDAFEDEYPNMAKIVMVTRIELVTIASLIS